MTAHDPPFIAVHMLDQESTNTVSCPGCFGRMGLVRILPRTGPYPELRTFRCTPCGEVETRPVDEPSGPIAARWPSNGGAGIHF